MMGETKEGRIRWSVEVQTTEANPVEENPLSMKMDWIGRLMSVMFLIIANTKEKISV